MQNYSVAIVMYNIFLVYFVPWIVTNYVRLGLSVAQKDQISTFLSDWTIKYESYINPATYGRISIGEINLLYVTVRTYINSIKQQIKVNPIVTLGVLDYAISLIHKNKSRRNKIPAPTQKCKIIDILKDFLNTKFRVFDIANQSSEAKPTDVKRIGVKLLVVKATDSAPTFEQLLRQDDEGSMIFDLPFVPDQEGWIGYISVCFLNDDGDEGEWSPILRFEV